MKKRGLNFRNLFFVVILFILFFFVLSINARDVLSQIKKGDYEISVGSVFKHIRIGEYEVFPITIKNKKSEKVSLSFSFEGNISSFIKIDRNSLDLEPNSEARLNLSFFGERIGTYNGSLLVYGDISEVIPVYFIVSNLKKDMIHAIVVEIEPLTKQAYLGEPFRYRVDIQNLLTQPYELTLYHSISKVGHRTTYIPNKTFFLDTDRLYINASTSIIKEYEVPDFIKPGEYLLTVEAKYLDLTSSSSLRFVIKEKVMDFLIFGILPVRWVFLFLAFLSFPVFGYLIYRRQRKKRKRYQTRVNYSLLAKPGPRSVKIGKIAETNRDVYFELDQLMTHTLIAGSTGGGKTVAAEVLVEEALLNNVAVIAFDPTAQWSGFLRRCQNKKMLALYPKFGLKKTDARAFNGNVHQIINARQVIDIKKYMVPGEIHVFCINRLDPSDADILVSNTIRQVFKANLPEATELKLLIIFDEVHRLLPKFGGSGRGFIQIERGAREFRKWGVGLVLISQVLSDFVGEIKANINTEIQMRTRDQGDLDRIKNKYGAYMLQSLLKASTGTGMVENAAYNEGNPFFVTFRPLLHEHARLSDEELEKYNKYNEIIDDLEYQIEQLKEEGVDIFDLKLELKMAYDKVKAGSFNMVDIYLEGLRPRLEEQWKRLGKKPKKREIKLVSEEELEEEFKKAKRAREEYEKSSGKGTLVSGTTIERKKQAELPPLKLATGQTVTKVQELIDAVNVMDDETLKKHVNEEKNDFADWVKPLSESVSKKLKEAKSKEDIIAVLEELS